MNSLTKPQNTAAAMPSNPYSTFARKHLPVNFGKRVSFAKGLWRAAGEPLPADALFVAQVPDTMIIATRWAQQKPVERRMAYVRDGADFVPRESLGYIDTKKWELDHRNNKPKDPWSQELALLMLHYETRQLFTYFTSSAGGSSAIAALTNEYAMRIDNGLFGLPVIGLSDDFYEHPSYGRTAIPLLQVDHWQDDGVAPPAPQPDAAAMITVSAEPVKPVPDDMSDEIPW